MGDVDDGEEIRVELPGAAAVFTTRRGGISSPPYDSLNLGFLTADDPRCVAENRDRLAARLGVRLVVNHQVHGARVRCIDGPSEGEPPEADGLATTTPGLGLVALAADCLPIVIAGGGALAVLHAGWPGLAAGIVGEGVRTVRGLAGEARLEAVIGPGAGPCCYEVGDEVRERFADLGAEVRRGGNLDLPGIARRQLTAAGVATVHDVALCTICSDRSLLFSHRRDGGVTGRQAGVAWLT